MSGRKGADLLDGVLIDENTQITNQWLEMLVTRENHMPLETGAQWGTLPAQALELSHKVDALRERQNGLRRDLNRIIEALSQADAGLAAPDPEGAPPAAAPGPSDQAGTNSFLKGIARKLFSSKGMV